MRVRTSLVVAGLVVSLVSFGFAFSTASAGSGPEWEAGGHPSMRGQADDSACLACHQNPQFSAQTKNGEPFNLFVDAEALAHSVHGEGGMKCVDCHTGFEPAMGHGLTFESRREAALQLNESCAQCHVTQADQEQDGVHARARAEGMVEAAVCTDCHTAHEVRRLKDPATGGRLPDTGVWIAQTCQQCHSAIYDKYKESVHGSALINENNVDVPTCIDCHGVHIIEDPTTAAFRLRSPQLCAGCHTDPARMDKYGISTNVLTTYVADFHGTTVTIFERVTPDTATDKPVCYDCHGIHDIVRVDDPQKGLSVRQNILTKCQQCHPDATANFPDAWMSHYIPSPEKYPIVYYVNLFYKFFIPAVLGPMLILVVMDFGRMMINRFRSAKPVLVATEADVPAESVAEMPADTEAKEEQPVEAVQETPVELVEAPAVEALEEQPVEEPQEQAEEKPEEQAGEPPRQEGRPEETDEDPSKEEADHDQSN